jgi:sortase A
MPVYDRSYYRSRATALLLFFVFFAATACGNQPSAETKQQQVSATGAATGLTKVAPDTSEESASGGSEKTVKAVTPEDVLSEKERTGMPEFRNWNDKTGEIPKLANTANSSVGAIPAVKPFNFGRDPGGPEDKTLYLTVPKLGISGIPVFDSVTEESLKESVVHVPATGFPWQENSNTYIAGHRIGYEGTGSWHIFYDLDLMAIGDEISLKDAAGGEYYYRVTDWKVVGPDDIEVMEPVPGKEVITLQTCTLPDYKDRIIVQGELVDKKT